jgi:hypothetical protein
MKSLLQIRSPVARGFLVTLGAGLAERFVDTGYVLLMDIERGCFEDDGECCEGGWETSGRSNTWCVGKQSCCSLSEPESGLMRILSMREVGLGEPALVEPVELGGDGGKL